MQIKLKSLHLENFKGIKLLDVSFGEKTKINGQNASGKTTVFDAFTWLLFNKNSSGEEKFNVRPLDADGNRVDNVEIKVSAVMDVDGKEVELSKVQKQKWVKKRGTDVTELQGNENLYEIDGYPKSEADYKAYISGLVDEDLFKMLTNPQYFSGMKWKDQRDILMKFVSDISDVELAQQLNIVDGEDKHTYDSLIPELEKAPSTDDIQKKFAKALSEWKKKQEEIPVRIDELSKSLAQIDVAEQELAKADLERRIAEIDAKIEDSGKAVGDLCEESMNLQFDINGLYTEANDKLIRERRELENARDEAQRAFNDAHNAISDAQKQIDVNTRQIELEEQKKPDINKRWSENMAKVFDETPYLFDESKWAFDENSTICSLCGQKLPEDKIASLRKEFEQKKANAKASADQELAYQREKFLADRESVKKSIDAEADEIKKKIKELMDKNDFLQKKIEEHRKAETDAIARKNQLEKQLSELPEKPDMSQNEEYQQKKARYDELEKQIASLKDSTSEADAFKEERKALVAELDSVKNEIAKASKNIEIEERIGELEAEQKEVGQKVADQEKMLYLLEQFIKAKMLRISETINSKFKTVSWKLFENQYNGGLKECCECTVGGVPYSTLNSGHRIVAGLDIIQSLSELYGVTAPIFIDNCEAVSSGNLPDMDAQVISLYVSDDKELVVESID